MDGDDRGPGPQVGVADQGVQLAPGLYEPFVDLAKTLCLVGRVFRSIFGPQLSGSLVGVE